MKQSQPRGFSLVEVLVVIAIIGVLVTLLMPAIQSVRAASDRTKCMNNMKQIGLAMLNYESSRKALPGVGIPSQWAFSVQARILPFVEEEQLKSLIDFDKALMNGSGGSQTINGVQVNAAKTLVKTYLCPSDRQEPIFTGYNTATWAGTNYVVNEGTGTGVFYDDRYATDGLFWQASATRLADITDGISNTILASETLMGIGRDSNGSAPLDATRQMAQVSSVARPSTTAQGTSPLLTDAICNAASTWNSDRGASWIWGRMHRTGFNTYFPPNSKKPDCLTNGLGWYAARSLHPGGVNVVFGDGSVHFIQNSVNLNLWRAGATRVSGDSINGLR